jgi:enoyl-CoA hydratase/carnithine racemase
MAAEIAKAGPLGVQAARETLNLDLVQAFRAATEREMFQQSVLRETNDFKEGVRAGFDRREPVFTGT